MAISQLSLTDFRNLRSTTLEFDPGLNLISGKNGSGKTSLLEAIHVLCQAQSFRTHQLVQCIRHDRSGFLLFGRFDEFKAGLSKSGRKLEIRIDGESVKRRSDLVRRAPINIVNANSFALIEGSPQNRRKFIDWCLFHVEPSYADCWVEFQHALRQRNRLLKSRRDLNLLDYWDEHLLRPSIRLSEMREDYCARLNQMIGKELKAMLPELPIRLAYRPGWPEEKSLGESLAAQRRRDIQSGYSNVGIHRDDLYLTLEEKAASEVLSRGQSKRLCLTLILAALRLVNQLGTNRIIMLIDDLHSELDAEAQNQVYQQLARLDLQLFISNINGPGSEPFEAQKYKLFHVEHGTIKPRNFS